MGCELGWVEETGPTDNSEIHQSLALSAPFRFKICCFVLNLERFEVDFMGSKIEAKFRTFSPFL